MRITVVGAGYVGLVSGACLAELGNEVCCVENDGARLSSLQHGLIPIYEPGLDALVRRNTAAGRLAFSGNLAAAVPGADMVFLAVGTPARAEDGGTDLSQVLVADPQFAAPHLGDLHALPTSPVVDLCAPVAGGADFDGDFRGFDHPLQPNLPGQTYDAGADEVVPAE